VSFGQTAPGKAALLGAFAGGLFVNRVNYWLEISLIAAVMSYLPTWRRLLTSVAALYWLIFHHTWLNGPFLSALAKAEGLRTDGWNLKVLFSGILAAVFCALAVFFHYARTRRSSFAAKRPVLLLVASYAAVLAAAGLIPLHGMTRLLAWGVVAMTAPYLWYFAYALKDASSKSSDGAILQFGTLQPFWGGTNVPYPKGAANLRTIEARNPMDLCITQLKAIKLLIWVVILRVPSIALQVFVHGEPRQTERFLGILRSIGLTGWNVPNMGVPSLDIALHHAAVLPVPAAWVSVITHFAEVLIGMTMSGNLIIGCCRMAGFYALRNTYRPLEARTVAEFWNRYYYYFKELLVEFFFFPFFTRYFKQYRRFRLFAATMAAATMGNMLYHFLRDYEYVAQMGFWQAVKGFQVYAFYTTVLGLGIGISQLRSQGRERSEGDARWWRRACATAGVLLFFCLLEIFDEEGRAFRLGEYLRFFLRLFLIPV